MMLQQSKMSGIVDITYTFMNLSYTEFIWNKNYVSSIASYVVDTVLRTDLLNEYFKTYVL